MSLILEGFKALFYVALLLFFVGLAVSVFRDEIRACTNKNTQGGAIGDVLLTLVVVSALISMMTQIPESMILMVSGIKMKLGSLPIFIICIVVSFVSILPMILSGFIHAKTDEN